MGTTFIDLSDIINTLIGVFVGGVLTLYVNGLTERKKLRLQMKLDTYNELRALLEQLHDNLMDIVPTILAQNSNEDKIAVWEELIKKHNEILRNIRNIHRNKRLILSRYEQYFDYLFSTKHILEMEEALNSFRKAVNENRAEDFKYMDFARNTQKHYNRVLTLIIIYDRDILKPIFAENKFSKVKNKLYHNMLYNRFMRL